MRLRQQLNYLSQLTSIETGLNDSESTSSNVGRILMVTSAQHGEGVSTIARRLALGLSRKAGDTLLVDCNLRSDTTNSAGDNSITLGLYNTINNPDNSLNDIQISKQKFIHFLPSGKVKEHPATLISSASFYNLMESLRLQYSWILLDTPPVIPYPDSPLISYIADGIILVIRAERTYDRVVLQARRVLERSGGILLGAILNRRRYHVPEWLYQRL